jgi:hypothetical protein
MTLEAACGWTALRAAVVTSIAVPICYRLYGLLLHSTARVRVVLWCLVILPFFWPRMITGYAYANFSLSLVHLPFANELFYDLLSLFGAVPIGVVVLYFAPKSPISRDGLHVWRLTSRSRRDLFGLCNSLWLWLHGPRQSAVLSAALLFLVVFQEFEMSSLMSVTSWTVTLFDAHAGGLSLRRSLGMALLPAFAQTTVLAPACALLVTGKWDYESRKNESLRGIETQGFVEWFYVALSLGIFCAIPAMLVFGNSLGALASLTRNTSWIGDILTGGMISIVSGVIAYASAAWVWRQGRGLLLFGCAGLLGSLVIGLCMLALFQSPVVNLAWDSVLPWILGLGVYLWPRALLIYAILKNPERSTADRLVQLLAKFSDKRQQSQARVLAWQIRGQVHLWSLGLICTWAYFDATLAAILAPVGWVSAPVRLYNLMHYGQSNVLSALVLVMFLAPLAFFSVVRLLGPVAWNLPVPWTQATYPKTLAGD